MKKKGNIIIIILAVLAFTAFIITVVSVFNEADKYKNQTEIVSELE